MKAKAKTREDIIQDLIDLDKKISIIYDDTDDMFEMIIVGGSALLLLNKISRATNDIDTIRCSKELKSYMIDYDINDRVISYENNFSIDMYNRLVKLDIPTKRIVVYTASVEDIVISKLCSDKVRRPKDFEDIANPLITQNLNWDLLKEIALSEDFKSYMLNDHAYQMFYYNYLEYVEENKK